MGKIHDIWSNDCFLARSQNLEITLTEESPSTTIHGNDLRDLKNFIISTKNGTDFFLDFSHHGCQNIHDPRLVDKESGCVRLCLDPFPFFVNHQVPVPAKCHQPLPHQWNMTQMLYSYTFIYENLPLNRLNIVASTKFNTIFGISIRVRQWIDESQRLLVVPVDPSENEYILVKTNVITTIVVPALEEKFYQQTMAAGIEETNYYCLEYQSDITCNARALYSIYSGPVPSLSKADELHLIDLQAKQSFISKTTALTVFTKSNCSFCLSATLKKGKPKLSAFYDTGTVFTSYNYPWSLIDSKLSDDCETATATDFSIVMTKIETLENGILHLTGYQDSDCEADVYYNQSFSKPMDNETQVLDVSCLKIKWCPNNQTDSLATGVLLKLRSNLARSPFELNCSRTIELTKVQPHLILNGLLIYQNTIKTKLFLPICVTNGHASGEKRIIIDLSVQCSLLTLGSACPSKSPIEINGEVVNLDYCSKTFTTQRETLLLTCRFHFEGFVYVRVYDQRDLETASQSAISFRSEEWTKSPRGFELIPYGDQLIATYHFEQQINPTWISLSLNRPGVTLIKFRWAHMGEKCAYDLNSGPPEWTEMIDENKTLITFRDDEAFVTQFLESNLYSILVPPGCAPSINIYREYGKVFEWLLDFQLQVVQHLCNGTVIFDTAGYQNPFEYHDIYDEKQFHWQNVTCDLFLIDIVVEVISLGNENLILNFQKENGTTELVFLARSTTLPHIEQRFNYRGVNVVRNIDLFREYMDGCFVRIHVTRKYPQHPISSTNSYELNFGLIQNLLLLFPSLGFFGLF
ncbi:unnamed protein product, partial [Mesorhabditis belari]|uniref:Uncharacterized protein n=1 Tax=Mesorhabditis belari TaxID=2138241 RepID=A0AAF3EIZ6_9BILA